MNIDIQKLKAAHLRASSYYPSNHAHEEDLDIIIESIPTLIAAVESAAATQPAPVQVAVVPDGWPTKEMREAGKKALQESLFCNDATACWEAMLAAAPAATSPAQHEHPQCDEACRYQCTENGTIPAKCATSPAQVQPDIAEAIIAGQQRRLSAAPTKQGNMTPVQPADAAPVEAVPNKQCECPLCESRRVIQMKVCRNCGAEFATSDDVANNAAQPPQAQQVAEAVPVAGRCVTLTGECQCEDGQQEGCVSWRRHPAQPTAQAAPASQVHDLVKQIEAMRCVNPYSEDKCNLYKEGFAVARKEAAGLAIRALAHKPASGEA